MKKLVFKMHGRAIKDLLEIVPTFNISHVADDHLWDLLIFAMANNEYNDNDVNERLRLWMNQYAVYPVAHGVHSNKTASFEFPDKVIFAFQYPPDQRTAAYGVENGHMTMEIQFDEKWLFRESHVCYMLTRMIGHLYSTCQDTVVLVDDEPMSIMRLAALLLLKQSGHAHEAMLLQDLKQDGLTRLPR